MKKKVKLDQQAMQQFLLDHGEKIALGAVVLVSLYFVYAGVSQRGYQKTPKNLEEKCKTAEDILKATEAKPLRTLIEQDDPEVRRRQGDLRLQDKSLQTAYVWDRVLLPRAPARRQPRLLPVRDLRGTAGAGVLALMPQRKKPVAKGQLADAPRDVRGQRWIVLTGLVPATEQLKEFNDCLRQSLEYKPDRDRPMYRGFIVERAEITDTGQGENPQWKRIFEGSAGKLIYLPKADDEEDAPAYRPERDIVDPRCLHERLAPQVPLRTDRKWKPEEISHPKIPLARLELGDGRRTGPGGKPEPPEKVRPKDDPFGMGVEPVGPHGPGVAPPPPEEVGTKAEEESMKEPDSFLFRFFDFDVEPGATYRYRVFLVLDNPNYGVSKKFLEREELAESRLLNITGDGKDGNPFKPTEDRLWSNVTDPISVPEGVEVLAAFVTPPGRVSPEPLAKIQIKVFLLTRGIWAKQDFPSQKRGYLLDYAKIPWRPRQGRASFRVNFVTGTTVLDMIGGGEKLSDRDDLLLPAADVLLIDRDGNAVIRNVLDDTAKPARAADTETGDETEPDAGEGPAVRPPPRGGTGLELLDEEFAAPGRKPAKTPPKRPGG